MKYLLAFTLGLLIMYSVSSRKHAMYSTKDVNLAYEQGFKDGCWFLNQKINGIKGVKR